MLGPLPPDIMKPSNKDTDTKQTLNQKPKNKTAQEERKMKKIIKKTESKKGLSLVEVICVIAIICILAGAILFNYIHIFRNAIDALGGI